MSIPDSFLAILGEWAGRSRLWLDPNQPAVVSKSAASAALAAQGQFLTLRYTWAFEGQPQEGLLVVGCELKSDHAAAAWIDSWHMAHQMMFCSGRLQPDNTLAVHGTYSAPPGPDWGWRIVLDPREPDTLRMIMMNISPKGDETLAVEAFYVRRQPGVD